MEDLIKQLCTKYNLDETIVRKAIGHVLIFIKRNVPSDFDFVSRIQNQLQGCETLMRNAEEPLPPGTVPNTPINPSKTIVGVTIALITWLLSVGPILDLLKQILRRFFGDSAVRLLDSAGDGAELVSKLHGIGITKEKATFIVETMIEFMKQKLGPDVVDDLMEKVPALGVILGSKKND